MLLMQTLKKAVNWCWNHLEKLAAIGWGIMSFSLPAWAASAADLFSAYAPFSWVAAGFGGLLVGTIIWAIIGIGAVLVIAVIVLIVRTRRIT